MIASVEGSDLAGTSRPGWRDAVACMRQADGAERLVPLELLAVTHFASSVPFRRFPSWRGQRHMPGLYWSATMGGHVGYESRLELAVLQAADFDRSVTGIYSQPLQLRVTDSQDRERTWVPDFLLAHDDCSLRLVEVKPARRAAAPAVAGRLAFFGTVSMSFGLRFEVRSEPDPVALANVVFLSGFRRRNDFSPSILDAVRVAAAAGVMPLASLESCLAQRWVAALVRPHVLHLLWTGSLQTDLSALLSSGSLVWYQS